MARKKVRADKRLERRIAAFEKDGDKTNHAIHKPGSQNPNKK